MEMKEYLEKSSKILDELQTTEQGLSEAEAARRLSEHGPNRLAAGKKKSNLQRFFEELKDPMILILLAAALISGITSAYEGESYADVVIILTVVIINAVLGVLQESKAEKAIEALQEIAAATSKVMRGGKMEVKKSEELVPGDIVILEAGDAVPADGRILESASMKIEEAALTGESVPVNKTADVLNAGAASEVPLGDRKNMVYMGSTVVYGRGRAVITGTGMKTEMGKIAHVLTQSAAEPAQQNLKRDGARHLCRDFHCRYFKRGRDAAEHLKYLYGSCQPCRSGNSGRTCSSCHNRAFHRCDQNVKAECGDPETDGCRDARLYAGDLLG